MLAACAVTLACVAAPAGEPPAHTAPWFDPAWTWRQIVRVDQPETMGKFPTGAATIEVEDLARPDGADVRVADADARVMPHVVLSAEGGRVSVRFKLAEGRPAVYYVYYGNAAAGPPTAAGLPETLGGLRLEMREYTGAAAESGESRRRGRSGGRIESLDEFRAAFEASPNVIGSSLRPQINDSANPYSQNKPRCLATYEGTLRVPVSGDYGLRFKATGLAYLLLDGQQRLTQTRALGQYVGDDSIFLERGDHTIAFYLFSRHPTSYIAQLQWRPPGGQDYETVPASAFPADVGFSVVGRQRFQQPVNAYFTAGIGAQVRLVRTDAILTAVRFHSLSASSLGELASCTWDFGDGETSAEPNPEHTYTKPGTYTATLTARDSLGLEASYSRTITLPRTVRSKMELVLNQQEERKIIRGEAGPDSDWDRTVHVRLGLKFLTERGADVLVEQRLVWGDRDVTLFAKRLGELVEAESRTFEAPLDLPGFPEPLVAAYRIAKVATTRLEREIVIEAELPNLPGRFTVTSVVRHGEVELGSTTLRVLLDTDPFPELAAYDPNLVDMLGNHLIVKTTGSAELPREPLATVLADSPRALRVALVDNSLCPGGPGYDETKLFPGILQQRLEVAFPSRTVTVERLAAERDTLGHFPVKRLLETGQAIERLQPHAVVISLDQTDITAFTPTETIETYYRLLINHVAAHTRAKIVLVTPPPMPFTAERSKVFALALGRLALERNVELADAYEAVNLHEGDWKSLFLDEEVKDDVYMMYMNTTGQRLVADAIFKAMLKE